VTTSAGARVSADRAGQRARSVIASTSKTLDPARDYSAIAVGNATQPTVLVLADENYVPTSSTARVRFANALDGSASVDALVNSLRRRRALRPARPPRTTPSPGANSYNLTFATSGGVSVLAALSPVGAHLGWGLHRIPTRKPCGASGAPRTRPLMQSHIRSTLSAISQSRMKTSLTLQRKI
jgi:hypothetical protein